jgi:hypothetical protein
LNEIDIRLSELESAGGTITRSSSFSTPMKIKDREKIIIAALRKENLFHST